MRTRQAGGALVELALILPFLLLLTLVTTEFGRAMYEYNTITKSVRDAVRYLSTQTPNTGQAIATNLIVYGNPQGTGSPLALGLVPSHVIAPVWQTTGTIPAINTVTVTVRGYFFRPLFANVLGVVFAGGNGTIAYADITATMRSPS